MRPILLLVPAALLCCSPSPQRERGPARAASPASSAVAVDAAIPGGAAWVTVARGALAEVSVERVLYEEPGHPHFYAHVRVQNPTTAAVGADLRRYYGVFRVNQWGASSLPNRGTVDERRIMPDGPLAAAEQAALLADQRAGALTAVPAHGNRDYFIEFNANDRGAVEAQSKGAPYVILAMDGQLRATDGRIAERVDPASDDRTREVTLDTPVQWATIPAGALVLRSP